MQGSYSLANPHAGTFLALRGQMRTLVSASRYILFPLISTFEFPETRLRIRLFSATVWIGLLIPVCPPQPQKFPRERPPLYRKPGTSPKSAHSCEYSSAKPMNTGIDLSTGPLYPEHEKFISPVLRCCVVQWASGGPTTSITQTSYGFPWICQSSSKSWMSAQKSTPSYLN